MATPSLEPGARLGRYRLVKVLGAGGLGVVWEAVLEGPRGFRKPVALKVLAAASGDPVLDELLVAEARRGARIHHPNVVTTYELARAGGRWLVAMELVRGTTLAALLRQGPLEPGRAVDLGLQVCAALAHVHGHGLVHQDLKPANLLIDAAGTVKLADLGAAGPVGERARLGTPRYLSPEQAAGRPVDGRSDLFGLGLVLAECVTGSPLLPSGRAGLRVGRAPVEVPPEVDLRLPGFGAVVARCLALDPADRWPDARALAAALAALVPTTHPPAAGVPSRPLPTGTPPRPADRFVGRRRELAELADALAASAVVTIVGPGGIGKTRLALEAIQGRATVFADLSEARDEDELRTVVAAALGAPAAAIPQALCDRGPVLLVLDNLEQVAGPAAHLVDAWAAAAPEARFLGTSRLPLGLRRERTVALGPLAADDATALFVDRSRREVDPAEVRDLVAQVEGFPLAIELLAARTRWLPVAELARRLGDRLALLTHGGPDRPERHRSMEACLEASFALLPAWARLACAQLSVFEGGFTLDAAAAVLELGPDAPSPLDVVEHLVDASLVAATGDRLRLPVLVQAFAARHLDPEARACAEARHGAAFAPLGEQRLPREPTTTERATVDLENLVAACERAIARRDAAVAEPTFRAACLALSQHGPFERAIALGRALLTVDGVGRVEVVVRMATLLKILSRNPEARALLEDALRAATPSERAHLLVNLGRIAAEEARLADARALYDEAIALASASGQRYLEAVVWGYLGNVERAQRRTDAAAAAYERAAPVLRELGARTELARNEVNHARVDLDRGLLEAARARLEGAVGEWRAVGNRWEEGVALGNLAVALTRLDRLDEAQACIETSLAIHRPLGGRATAASGLGVLGAIRLEQGDPAGARAALEQALAELDEVGWPRAAAYVRLSLADLERREGRPERAAQLLERAEQVLGGVGEIAGEGVAVLGRARLRVDAGDPAAARALLDRAEGLLRGGEAPFELTTALVVRAELAARLGDRDAAARLLDAARRHADGLAPWTNAHREIRAARQALGLSAEEGG